MTPVTVPQSSGLGSLESEIMKVLWKADAPMTVRDVLDRLNRRRRPPLAYTTVMTVLVRLNDKGALRREPAGRGFAYAAVVDDAAGIAVNGVLRDFGDAALAHFVAQAQQDPQLARRLRRLMKADGEAQPR